MSSSRSAGLRFSKVFPDFALTHRPPMKLDSCSPIREPAAPPGLSRSSLCVAIVTPLKFFGFPPAVMATLPSSCAPSAMMTLGACTLPSTTAVFASSARSVATIWPLTVPPTNTDRASISPSTSPPATTLTSSATRIVPSRRPATITSSSPDRFPTKHAPGPMTVVAARVAARPGSLPAATLGSAFFTNVARDRFLKNHEADEYTFCVFARGECLRR